MEKLFLVSTASVEMRPSGQGRKEVRWIPGQQVWRPHVRTWGLS